MVSIIREWAGKLPILLCFPIYMEDRYPFLNKPLVKMLSVRDWRGGMSD